MTHQLKGVHPAKSGQSQLRYLKFWSIHVNHPIWTTKSHIVCAFLFPTHNIPALDISPNIGRSHAKYANLEHGTILSHKDPTTRTIPCRAIYRKKPWGFHPLGMAHGWAPPLLTQLITALSDCLLETYGPAVDAGS